jgi:hypothetical protein
MQRRYFFSLETVNVQQLQLRRMGLRGRRHDLVSQRHANSYLDTGSVAAANRAH